MIGWPRKVFFKINYLPQNFAGDMYVPPSVADSYPRIRMFLGYPDLLVRGRIRILL